MKTEINKSNKIIDSNRTLIYAVFIAKMNIRNRGS